MNKTIRGLVLKSAPFKENYLLLTILTSEQGKMNVLCRGVRRSKKTVLYTQPFVYSEFDLFCGKGLAVVDGAEVCEAFYGLREDIVCLALAQYLCDVAAFAAGGRGNAAMLRLLLNSLSLLAEKKTDPTVIKIVFELRYALLEGFAPVGGTCCVCGQDAVFWQFANGLLCERCAGGSGYRVSAAVVAAIEHVLTASGRRMYAFRMNPEALAYLSRLTQENIRYHLEYDFASLKYYQQFTELERSVLPQTGTNSDADPNRKG